ncbi:hypothetical protein SCHPADRAFT_1001491 [Schizopora paradoxa]|uniref:Zn(2)-C6 fungal-type domain-containing protein n=1 Tax=Schizopora paradoxa TaxID=27342 RepID=A0A0H2R738_9AGAM|nr:hypothetical protein SCHPADRAFT_1001491 [Schizopora paradoxa]
MATNVLDTTNAVNASKEPLSKNKRPCIACSMARKKCELVEGKYPCKRCLDRFIKGTTNSILCEPSRRRSRFRKNDKASELTGKQQWMSYNGAQEIFVNGNVAPQAYTHPPSQDEVALGTDQVEQRAPNENDILPFIANPDAFGQAYFAGGFWGQ